MNPMIQPNPFIVSALGSVLRWALALGAGYLVRLGVWNAADADTYVSALAAAGALALASLALSLWQKYRSRRTLLVALAAPRPMTEQQAGVLATRVDGPSVTTPKDRIPVVMARG